MENNSFEHDLVSLKRQSLIFSVAGVILFVGGAFLGFRINPVAGVVCIGLGICLIVYAGSIGKKLRNLTSPVIRSVLEEKMEVDSFEPNQHFDRKLVKNTKLFTGWSSISGSDLVTGKYRGIPVRFCDLKLTHEESSGNDSTVTVTDFSGTFIEVTAHRSIGSEVRIKEQGKGLFGRSKVIETENEAFNRQFTVTGDSQQDAFYILTPQFMETIINADKYANAKTQMLFTGNQIYIGLYNSKDLFETGKEKTMEGLRDSCRRDLVYVTDFLDLLFGNTALFDPGRMK